MKLEIFTGEESNLNLWEYHKTFDIFKTAAGVTLLARKRPSLNGPPKRFLCYSVRVAVFFVPCHTHTVFLLRTGGTCTNE